MNKLMTVKMKLKKNQKGLTLIELLAVIVILGIVSAIAVPAIGGIITSSKTQADSATDTMVEEAVRLKLAADNQDTVLGATTPVTGTVASLSTLGYLSVTPTWNTAANKKVNYSASFIGNTWIITLSAS